MQWHRIWVGIGLAAVLAGSAVASTEFGGMISGPDALVTNVLGSLSGREGFRWIRSASPRVAEFGFQGIGDIRNYVPRDGRARDVLPDDLFEVYHAARTNLPAYPGAPRVWEVWNEPDFYFVRDSAADMAAVLKAAWWGVKTVDPEARVLMPSMAFRPTRYALELAMNGLASWTDGLNFHYYGWAADYPAFLAQYRTFTEAIGLTGPWWLTEIGDINLPANASSDPEALSRQAAFHLRTMATSAAFGVERHLFFILTPYVSVRRDLGLTDAEARWRPALADAVQLAHRLPRAEPIHRIVHVKSGEDVGLVFRVEDGNWWTFLWFPGRTGEGVLPAGDLRPPMPQSLRLGVRWPRRIREIHLGLNFAVPLVPEQLPSVELGPNRSVHLLTPPIRFELEGCRWIDWDEFRSQRPRVSPSVRAELRKVPPRREPSPGIVHLTAFGPAREDKPSQALRIPMDQPVPARLKLYNFSAAPLAGRWRVAQPPGWVLERVLASTGSGLIGEGECSQGSLEGDLTLPPLGQVTIDFRIVFNAARLGLPVRLDARWSDESGRIDEGSVQLEPLAPPAPIWHRFGWRDFLPRPSEPDAWQALQLDERTIAVEARTSSGPNRDLAVHFPLPSGLRSTDVFAVRLRQVQGPGPAFAQVHLSAGDGDLWRFGELAEVTREGLVVEARLGDFSPAIWARHRTFLFPPVERARWLTVFFQGVRPDDVFEFVEPALRRGKVP